MTTEVKLVKISTELLEKISRKMNIAPVEIQQMIRHNVFTITQFAQLCGKKVSTINKLSEQKVKGGEVVSSLDLAFPFPDFVGKGPKFILRNEKSEQYLLESLKK